MTRKSRVQNRSLRRALGKCFLADQSGSSLVELGVLLPAILAIILAVAEVAVYIQRSIVVVEAASVGVRFGVIAGNATNTAGMIQAAQNASGNLSGFTATAKSFCSCSPGGAQISCSSSCGSAAAISHYVQVTTTAAVPGIFHIAVLPSSISPLAVSTMRASWPQ